MLYPIQIYLNFMNKFWYNFGLYLNTTKAITQISPKCFLKFSKSFMSFKISYPDADPDLL